MVPEPGEHVTTFCYPPEDKNMADMPKWFDETYYLNAKLAQMQESDPGG